mmetsp:Transcript_26240/g.89739  ORF Transcript_26240/g.89739 Transcript_26240/m.89739 type:complete len:383 (-) Transcript_26240:885-2033(-)
MMKFFMRWNTFLAVTIAVTMTERPGSVRTMSLAPRAASVAPCTAIPTSARFSAGASFTPSPVMPTMCPLCLSACTMRYLCSGKTWLKPSASSIASPQSRPRVSLFCSSSMGRVGSLPAGRMLSPMPSCRAVSFATAPWSPVIIFTDTPSCLARMSVWRVSGRGGSRNVMIPRSSHLPCASVRATARERMPLPASSSTLASTSSRIASLLCTISSRTCGAPFVTLNSPPPGLRLSVLSVRFTVGSKGTWSTSSYASFSGPASTAPSTSVSSASFGGSFHFVPSAAASSTSSLVTPAVKVGMSSCSTILFSVRVPVLSDARMSMPASSSTALSLATIAFSSASTPHPIASVVMHTTRMAMGTLATSSTTQKDSVSRNPSPMQRR